MNKTRFGRLTIQLQDHPNKWLGAIALILLGYAFYNPALRFVPVDFDDLVLLSHVRNTTNPLSFFVQDWGFGNYGYRPLHSLSLWLGYQIFGVSSGPNQLINLLLHIAVILSLYVLLSKIQEDHTLAFIFSALPLVSLYTFSPPTWVSDRPTLLVAFFLMLMLNYLAQLKEGERPNMAILLILSALALMSKESGLLVPLIAAIVLVVRYGISKKEYASFFALGSLVLLYALLRFVLFGTSAAAYDEAGYLFGSRYYENAASLTTMERLFSMGENVIKNFLAIFLPVFDGQGKISLIGTLSNSTALVISTTALSLLALSRKLPPYQKIGLAIILLNALLHYQVFRYRTLYLAQIGFSIFLAASTQFTAAHTSKKFAALILSSLFVLWNIHIIGEDITYIYLAKLDAIQQLDFEATMLASSHRMDPQVIRQIIEKYRH